MKYWIIALLMCFIAGAASASNIVRSELLDEERIGSLTTYTWEVVLDAPERRVCFVYLSLTDSKGNLVDVREMKIDKLYKGVQTRRETVTARTETAARWVSSNTELDCY